MGDEQSAIFAFRGDEGEPEAYSGAPLREQSAIRQTTRRHPHDPPTKRWFDFTAATLLLLLLAPGLLGIALAIRLTSRGPALFTQPRYGRNGELFGIYKFRTMYIDHADPSGVRQTRRGDPRVTPFGRFLRRTNLDEVPQLLNVVKGDMSLVGPRPHVPGMLAGGKLYEELVPYYFDRGRVRPGITGLAQVKGLRGSTEDASLAVARVDHDLEYIENWSFALDVRILVETVRTELLSGGSGI
jgi:lipopolysaccharide/colanic/teichoic acid biosynthesis glycosyltransferase